MSSPTQRTTKELRERGLRYEITEWFDHRRDRKHDLLGFIDIVYFREDGKQVGVQVTGGGNTSARRKKILYDRTQKAMDWLRSGCLIEIHDWRKVKLKRGGKAMRWRNRVTPITLADFWEILS